MQIPFILTVDIGLLAASWAAVYAFERRNLFREWLMPLRWRLGEFGTGFLLMAFLSTATHLLLSWTGGTSWSLSPELSLNTVLSSAAFDLYSVLFEELLYRGVLLYFLVKYVGLQAGLIISSVAFGIDHWWSYNALGNPAAMAAIFLTTGFMGYVFALAFIKTDSVILPVALHLGWNLVNNTLFSSGPRGAVTLIPDYIPEMEGIHAAIALVVYLLVPALVLLFVRSPFVSSKDENRLVPGQ